MRSVSVVLLLSVFLHCIVPVVITTTTENVATTALSNTTMLYNATTTTTALDAEPTPVNSRIQSREEQKANNSLDLSSESVYVPIIVIVIIAVGLVAALVALNYNRSKGVVVVPPNPMMANPMMMNPMMSVMGPAPGMMPGKSDMTRSFLIIRYDFYASWYVPTWFSRAARYARTARCTKQWSTIIT